MDVAYTVLPRGTVYVEGSTIAAVQDAAQPPPPAFAGIVPTDTGGSIYPGLIELHNHLSYNALRLWEVPKRYGDRSQWSGTAQYQELVTQPMKTLGTNTAVVPALVRYVECKCLMGGVTTSQGIALFSDAGIRRFYKGILRVTEATSDPALPEAGTRIADVVAKDRQAFLTEIGKRPCFLLHLSEGTDAAARAHFQALQFPDGTWALAGSLAGIHSVALQAQDFAVMAAHGAAMVWSPLSNLLLYGGTADVAAARAAGVAVGIGSDWAPSGSKNLLGELKVARIYAQNAGLPLADRDLVAMATRDAAAILRWHKALGSIEAGKRADLLVVDGAAGDPYAGLISATEASIALVAIDGVPRFGRPDLMVALGASGEAVTVAGRAKMLYLTQSDEDPAVAAFTLSAARATLAAELAGTPLPPPLAPAEGEAWKLALDELGGTGMSMRPMLEAPGNQPTSADPAPPEALAGLPPVTLELDPLTVPDDSQILTRLAAEPNLPGYLAADLSAMY
ncbi:MAG: amidohydrolase family protein [Candidatus Dormibacteraeota bacterium]|nr:amidohydrolase family protein [Candidatus Dormibacteraeota bacterium]